MKLAQKKVINQIVELIKNQSTFLLASHVHPDGDSLGSLLGLGTYLSKYLSKNVDIVVDNGIPRQYSFLPNQHLIKKKTELAKHYPVIIVIECPDKLRLGNVLKDIEAPDIWVNIDHHEKNTHFGNINYIDTNASACGEQIYKLLIQFDKNAIDKDIATCLYTAILTDTGKFTYRNTKAETHRIVAHLLSIGIDHSEIAQKIYNNQSLQLLKLLGKMLDTVQCTLDNKVVYGYISKEMFLETNTTPYQTEGFVDYLQRIGDVEVFLLFQEMAEENRVKVSFRARNSIDVDKIASVFGGGGHKKAAGCQIQGKLSDVIPAVLNEVEKHLNLSNEIK